MVLLFTRGISITDIAILVTLYFTGTLSIEAGYHRLFSHRAFQATSATKVAFAIAGAINAQGPPLFWAAIHRRHHQHTDRAGDPHSPHFYASGETISGRLRGLWHAHVGWLFVHDITDWARYVPDLIRDKTLFKINRLYFVWLLLGLILPAAVGGVVSWTWMGVLTGFLWGGLARIFISHQVTWAVNSICHVYGSRPFIIQDRSANNAWLAVISVGGSWHNNHHAFPTAPILATRWWQIDPSGWLIRALAMAGLVGKVEPFSRHGLNRRSHAAIPNVIEHED